MADRRAAVASVLALTLGSIVTFGAYSLYLSTKKPPPPPQGSIVISGDTVHAYQSDAGGFTISVYNGTQNTIQVTKVNWTGNSGYNKNVNLGNLETTLPITIMPGQLAGITQKFTTGIYSCDGPLNGCSQSPICPVGKNPCPSPVGTYTITGTLEFSDGSSSPEFTNTINVIS
jgi:hypothetical protein